MPERVYCRVLENVQVQAASPRHSWIADRPPEDGGDGLGPSPRELLLSALGASAATEVASQAASAGIPVEGTAVDLRLEDTDDGSRIRCTVRVRGALGEGGVDRVRRWAEGCPVAVLLAGGADLEVDVERVEP